MDRRRPTMMLLALAVVLCLGSSLTSRAVRSEISATLASAGAHQAQHPSGGFRHHLGGGSLTVIAEKTDARDRLPANAAHLTALVLGFLVATVWWLNSSALAPSGSRNPSLLRSWFLTIVCFVQRRRVATLSGVFRL